MTATLISLPHEMALEEDYQTASGLRWSHLKFMRESPLHFHTAAFDPELVKQSDALLLGGAVHCRVFEPEHFASRFVCYSEPKSKGEGSRKRWQEFQEQNADKSILDAEQWEQTNNIANKIITHPLALELLQIGRAEVPLRFWEQDIEGKAKLDWLHAGSQPSIVDLKTARFIEQRRFQSAAWSLGYFHQADYYRRALAFNLGCQAAELPFYIIAVEPAAPHDVAVYRLDDDSLQVAHAEVEDLLQQLRHCRARGEWPGRYNSVMPLCAPRWAMDDDDDPYGAEVIHAGS